MSKRGSNQIMCIDEQSRFGHRYTAEPKQDVLTDLLTDIRHYCDGCGLDLSLRSTLSIAQARRVTRAVEATCNPRACALLAGKIPRARSTSPNTPAEPQ